LTEILKKHWSKHFATVTSSDIGLGLIRGNTLVQHSWRYLANIVDILALGVKITKLYTEIRHYGRNGFTPNN